MRSSDRGELRFRPCSCASFLLAQKGAGFLSYTLKETKGDLAFKPISEIFFLLSAKGSRFSFGRQKKQKRQGAVFRVRPLQPALATRKLLIPPQTASEREGTLAPLSKGAKNESLASGQMRQRRAHTIRHDRVGKRSSSYAIKARGGEPLRACVNYAVFRRCQGRENFSGLCPRNFSTLFLDKMSA